MTILTVALLGLLALAVLALGVSFVMWFIDPWRCDPAFDIFWDYDDDDPTPPAFRLIWIGWLVVVWETDRGWRGWSINLHTD